MRGGQSVVGELNSNLNRFVPGGTNRRRWAPASNFVLREPRQGSEAEDGSGGDASVRIQDFADILVGRVVVGVEVVTRDAPCEEARKAYVETGADCHGEGVIGAQIRNGLLGEVSASDHAVCKQGRPAEVDADLWTKQKGKRPGVEVGVEIIVEIATRNIALYTEKGAEYRNLERGVPAVSARHSGAIAGWVIGAEHIGIAAVQLEIRGPAAIPNIGAGLRIYAGRHCHGTGQRQKGKELSIHIFTSGS